MSAIPMPGPTRLTGITGIDSAIDEPTGRLDMTAGDSSIATSKGVDSAVNIFRDNEGFIIKGDDDSLIVVTDGTTRLIDGEISADETSHQRIINLEQENSALKDASGALHRSWQRTLNRVDILIEVVKLYTNHDPECRILTMLNRRTSTNQVKNCNCGLLEILEQVKGKTMSANKIQEGLKCLEVLRQRQ